MKVLKITTDDNIEILDAEKMSNKFLAPPIGCDYGDRGLCMLVDESGLLKESPKVNTFTKED